MGVAVALVVASCSMTTDTASDGSADAARGQAALPPGPPVPTGPLDPEVAADLDAVYSTLTDDIDVAAIEALGRSDDARVAWLLTDLLRFLPAGPVGRALEDSWETVTGTVVDESSAWEATSDLLIAWDLPAPPGYVEWKRRLYLLVEPDWAPFFADDDSDIDWRWITWGGVGMDDRPLDETDERCPVSCIPALNDPATTGAEGGDWYPDDAVVFGIEVGDAALALPKNMMEVHEMVNLDLGGRRLGVPYCTLCGSAQAYFVDDTADLGAEIDLGGTGAFELRTSGLLSRSNKVMYEFHTGSVFDTFTGVALSGPLREAGVELELISVTTSRWGEWKAAHPDTEIIAEDGGIGRSYPADPLAGRDDDGPIFPTGDVDPRLGVQEPVVGVTATDGTPIAFPVTSARAAFASDERVELDGIRLVADGGGFAAVDPDGGPIAAHEAFWFAWSQFRPDTRLWSPPGG